MYLKYKKLENVGEVIYKTDYYLLKFSIATDYGMDGRGVGVHVLVG
jgi:hypothetical protein